MNHRHQNEPQAKRRPVFVSVICILLLLGIILSIATYGSAQNQRIGSWYAPYNLVLVILQGFFAIGMWLMKRWAFFGFFALVAANIALHLAIGQWDPGVIVIFGIVCYFLYRVMPQGTNGKQIPDDSVL